MGTQSPGPSPSKKGQHVPNLRPMSILAKRSPISANAEHLYKRATKLSVLLTYVSSVAGHAAESVVLSLRFASTQLDRISTGENVSTDVHY